MRTVNPNLYPRDGYFFKDGDGLTVRGDSWEGVIKRVASYRRRNGRPPGDPAIEVMNQACARNPGLCVEESAAYKQKLGEANLKVKVLQWLQRILSLPEKQFVFTQDAQNRWAVCSRCPFNQALPKGCGSCLAAVEESRKNVIGARPQSDLVQACSVLGEDLNTAAWIEQVADGNPDLPAHCWRKRTL